MFVRPKVVSCLYSLLLLGSSTATVLAADSLKVVQSPSHGNAIAAGSSKEASKMDMGMDMKNCPMMRKSDKRKAYDGSAAIISNDFIWKMSPARVPQAGKPVTLNFNFNWKKDGKPLKDLEIVHEKPCHLIIVSDDLNEFQHIHPAVTAPGKMSVTTEFPKDGQYKMYMQYTVKGEPEYTLVKDLQVGNPKVKTPPAKLSEFTGPRSVDGYTLKLSNRPQAVSVESPMLVAIEKDGKPVENIDHFLGAGGHGVMISQDLSQYLHIHPVLTNLPDVPYKSPILFKAVVPKPGIYRAWMQFQIKGKIVIGIWDLVIKPQDLD